MRRGLASLLLLLASAASESSARADTGRTVEVTIQSGGDEAAPLEATVKELLARVGVGVVEPGSSTPVLARAVIDLGEPSVAHVRVVDRDGKEILKRDVQRETPSIAREAIAHEVQNAVESQLIVDEKPPPPQPPPPVATVETPPPPIAKEEPPKQEPDPFALDVSTFAGGGPIASDTGLVPRFGGSTTVATNTGRRYAITIGASYAIPFEQSASFVTARTSFVAVRAMPSVELIHARYSLEVAAGAGFDVISVRPRSDSLPDESLQGSSTRVDAILEALLTQKVTLTPGFVVYLSTGLDVDLETRGYVVQQGADRNEVLKPWRVRPVAYLGVSFTAFGGGK